MAAPIVLQYQKVASPLGPVTVIERGGAVFAVELSATPLETLKERYEQRLRTGVELVERSRLSSAQQLAGYFAGRREKFELTLDLAGLPSFARSVLEALARVPFGKLVSYGELAARAGSPKASRAVGGAMARNPIPIIVPCHRVVAADGSLGGFSGGLGVKRRLLAHEGVAPLAGGWEKSQRA